MLGTLACDQPNIPGYGRVAYDDRGSAIFGRACGCSGGRARGAGGAGLTRPGGRQAAPALLVPAAPTVSPAGPLAAEPERGRDARGGRRAAAQGYADRSPTDGAPVLRPCQPAHAVGA